MPKASIIKPIISEKGYADANQSKFSFNISMTEDKESTKKLIEEQYKDEVLSVNIKVRKGKIKLARGKKGKRSDQKIATVTLKSGQKIDLFETEKDQPKTKVDKSKMSKTKSTSQDKNN